MKRRFLTDFHAIRPRFERGQAELSDWLAGVHSGGDPEALSRTRKLLARYGCDSKKIAFRGVEIEDPSASAGIFERAQVFSERATQRMEEFFPAGTMAPDHLVHVTCTGYVSPSAAQTLVDRRGWSGRTTVTHAYHMGCYASLPAVRLAVGLVASQGGRADIVHNEYCSLHMDTSDHAPEQLVIQSLFADGNIKYSVTEHDGAPAGSGLEILRIHEQIIPSTGDQMSWVTGEWGMRMTLSREVPASVVRSLRQFLDGLLVGSGVSPEEAAETAIFAIHPGGPRIIDSIQEFAELRDEQVAHSRSVLLRYGNMSSATLPHVWRDLVADDSVAPGRPIVSLAFGPGLTIFGALLRKTGL